MPVFVTSDKLGQRPTGRATVAPQSYRAGVVEQAAVDAAGQLRQTGKQVQQFGENIQVEEERRAREQQAEQEKQNRLNDSLQLSQYRSNLIRESIGFRNDTAERQDYESFPKEFAERLDSVRKQYAGKFLTPEGDMDFQTSFSDFAVQEDFKLQEVIRGKNKDRTIASVSQTIADNNLAMGMARDDHEFNSLAENSRASIIVLREKGIIDEKTAGDELRKNEQDIADLWVQRRPPEEILALTDKAIGDDSGEISQDKVIDFVIDELEGGDNVVSDGGGISRYGINSVANPNVDVKNLTREKAVEIYKKKYWDANNISSLPKEIQPIIFDMYVNGFADVEGAIKKSGGDTEKLIQLRKDYFQNLTKENPEKYGAFLKGWEVRLDKLSRLQGDVIRQKTGTPLDVMPIDKIRKINQTTMGNIMDEFVQRDPEGIEEFLNSPEFSNLKPSKQIAIRNQAKSIIRQKKEEAEIAIIQSDVARYSSLIDKSADGNLSYTEIMDFAAEDPENSGKRKLSAHLLKQQGFPLEGLGELKGQRQADREEKLRDIMGKYDELMKGGDDKKTVKEGLSEFATLRQQMLEASPYMTLGQRNQIRNLDVVLRKKAENAGAPGVLWGYKDDLNDDPYAEAYRAIDTTLNANPSFNSPEIRMNIMARIAPTLDAMKEAGATKDDDEISAADKIMYDYLVSAFPQYASFKKGEFPNIIIADNGSVIQVPVGLSKSGAPVSGVVKMPEFKLQDSYTLKDGNVITAQDVIDQAKKRSEKIGYKIAPQQIIEQLKRNGHL